MVFEDIDKPYVHVAADKRLFWCHDFQTPPTPTPPLRVQSFFEELSVFSSKL
jgi:hypothetical protein